MILQTVTIFLWISTTSQVSGLDAWAASCTAVIFSKVCMLHGYRMVFSPCPWGGFKGWSPVLNNELTTGEKKQSCQKSGKHHSTSMFAAWRDVVDFCLMSVHGVCCTFIRITKWKSNLHVWTSFQDHPVELFPLKLPEQQFNLGPPNVVGFLMIHDRYKGQISQVSCSFGKWLNNKFIVCFNFSCTSEVRNELQIDLGLVYNIYEALNKMITPSPIANFLRNHTYQTSSKHWKHHTSPPFFQNP